MLIVLDELKITRKPYKTYISGSIRSRTYSKLATMHSLETEKVQCIKQILLWKKSQCFILQKYFFFLVYETHSISCKIYVTPATNDLSQINKYNLPSFFSVYIIVLFKSYKFRSLPVSKYMFVLYLL